MRSATSIGCARRRVKLRFPAARSPGHESKGCRKKSDREFYRVLVRLSAIENEHDPTSLRNRASRVAAGSQRRGCAVHHDPREVFADAPSIPAEDRRHSAYAVYAAPSRHLAVIEIPRTHHFIGGVQETGARSSVMTLTRSNAILPRKRA